MSEPGTTKHNWYIVYTCPNSEKKVYNEFNKRKITAFLPATKVIRQWSDRKKTVEVPLFPNYVFVNLPPARTWMALAVNRVVRVGTFDGAPVVVKETEIELVKKLLFEVNEVAAGYFDAEGEEVQIKKGPLTGLVGKVTGKKAMRGFT